MARPIRRIEIHLPLEYNDGEPIPEFRFMETLQQLLERYGGVTSVQRQFPYRGSWKAGGETYHDNVVILSVMDFREESQLTCLRYLERLKSRLKKKFDQLEMLQTCLRFEKRMCQ